MIVLSSLPNLFVQGGLFIMSLITILLVCLLFAAWKAPAWVKEIGLITLVASLISIALSWYQAADTLVKVNGEINPVIIWNGVKCHLTVFVYGLGVYLVSLIIRIIQKPRI